MALREDSRNPNAEERFDARTDPAASKAGREGTPEELAGNRKEARVFDILNCGPLNRFTVSGVLVHNCGYQGGNGALIQMGALDMGIPEEELAGMVRAWRDASPEIEAAWYAVEQAAKNAIQNPGKTFRPDNKNLPADAAIRGCRFLVSNGMLRIELPSGRCLCYIKPRLAKNAKGRVGIKYWGVHQKTKQWCELDTYGGKLFENMTQAFARDCLAVTMVKLYRTGYQMIMLVHDEIVFDLLLGFGSLAGVLGVMREEIPFAKGLPLKGAGYDDAPFYYKD